MRLFRAIGSSFLAAMLLGVALVPPPSARAAIEHPRIQWAFQTEGPIRGAAVVDGDSLYFGSADGFLYAVAKQDGALRWKVQTGGPIAGAPAVSGGTVIVAGRSDRVLGLATADGSIRWSFQMQPTLPTVTEWNFFTAAPVIDGEQVLVPSGDGRLYSLDVATGNLRWAFATGDSLRASPLVVGDTIYQPSGDDHVYALAADRGELRWKFATAGVGYDLSQGFIRSDIFTRPSLADGLLVFGSRDANVYAVDVATREARWTFAYDSTWAMATAVADGVAYAGWSTNNKINALELATGRQLWEFNAGSHTYAAPAIVGRDTYWASAGGKLHRLDAKTGEVKWSYALGCDLYSPPVYEDGRLYLGTDDGRMVAVGEGAAAVHKAVYLPAQVPPNLGGFVIDPALAPNLEKRGFARLDSAAALGEWLAARTADGEPSVVVFGYAQIPTELVGPDPVQGAVRAYLEAGGKVVWTWGLPNQVTFDADGKFLAHDPSVGARLLGVRAVAHQDSGNYFSRPTQVGRNWGLPVWLKTTFAYLQPDNDVTVLAHDEYGRVSAFVKTFHSRSGSGWVSFGPTGYGTPITASELATLERIACYGVQ